MRTYDISNLVLSGALFPDEVKRVSRKIHVLFVQQQQQRNIEKSMLHVRSCCCVFLFFFCAVLNKAVTV